MNAQLNQPGLCQSGTPKGLHWWPGGILCQYAAMPMPYRHRDNRKNGVLAKKPGPNVYRFGSDTGIVDWVATSEKHACYDHLPANQNMDKVSTDRHLGNLWVNVRLRAQLDTAIFGCYRQRVLGDSESPGARRIG
jgi:hypothetical protein